MFLQRTGCQRAKRRVVLDQDDRGSGHAGRVRKNGFMLSEIRLGGITVNRALPAKPSVSAPAMICHERDKRKAHDQQESHAGPAGGPA
jgi:hypothetical protein